MDEISKKDLLGETGISYGQLYRWKREGLIPEEWFVKKASFTGQETWFPKERVLERVKMILEKKDEQSLDDIRSQILGEEDDENDVMLNEVISVAELIEKPMSSVIFETKDGKHFVLLTKDGSIFTDSGVTPRMVLTEKDIRTRLKANEKSKA